MYVSNSDSRTPTLIRVVPGLTAQPNGVANYALGLARALRAYNGVNAIFVLGPASVHGKVQKNDSGTGSEFRSRCNSGINCQRFGRARNLRPVQCETQTAGN
jgi:hypothetical protein